MPIDVTFNAGLGDEDYAHQKILLVLVHGGAGASDGERVIGGTKTLTVGDTVALDDNDVLQPAGTFYRATMPGVSPPVVRHFRLASDTSSPVSWADPTIQVEAPVPPSFAVSVDGAIADAAAALTAVAGKEDEGVAAALVAPVAAAVETKEDAGTAASLIAPVSAAVATKEDAGVAAELVAAPPSPGAVPVKPALDGWFAKRSVATAAAPVDVVYITDSIGAIGTNAEPAWPWLVNVMLNEQAGAGTSPHPVFARSGDGGSVPVATSTTGTAAEIGLGGHSAALANGGTTTHTAVATSFRVTYVDNGTGTLTFRDGPGGTVIGTRVFTNTGKLLVWQNSTPLSAGTHTLHITSTGTTNVGQITPLNGNKIVGHMATHSGYSSGSYTTTPALALDLIEWLEANGNLGLVVLATGANDAPYSTMMPALIAAVQARTGADIAVWFPYLSNAVLAAEYNLAHPVALGLGLPLIDASTYFASFATSYTIDGTHPIWAGSKLLAEHIYSVLGGDPIGQLTKKVSLVPALGTGAGDAAPGNVLTASRGDSFILEDDFVTGDPTLSGSIGSLGWTRTNGTSVATTLGVTGHPGVVRVLPTTTAGNVASLTRPVVGVTTGNWRVDFWLKHAGAMDANVKLEFGLMGAGAFAHGVAVCWEAGAPTTWQVVSKFLGTETGRLNTAIVPTTNTWQKWSLVRFGTSVLAYLDDVLLGSLVGGGIDSMGLSVTNVAGGATARNFDLDRAQLVVTGIARPSVAS